MSNADKPYIDLLEALVDKATFQNPQDDRTGTGKYSIFGHQMRFNLAEEFPLLESKKVNFHAVKAELFWFLLGDTNIEYLLQHDVHIWTDWRYKEYCEDIKKINEKMIKDYECAYEADKKYVNCMIVGAVSKKDFEYYILTNKNFRERFGSIGKGYGHQWRNFGESVDQIKWVINEIKTNPSSRRLIVSGWNPVEIDQVDLPPCHTMFQFFVENGTLSCQLYQRSADVFLGLPFNIASYALLTHIIAKICGLKVGEFIWTGGDVHLYANHIDQAKQQISQYRNLAHNVAKIKIGGLEPIHSIDDIADMDPAQISVINYTPMSSIKAPVAI